MPWGAMALVSTLGSSRVGSKKKSAARLSASSIFLDESGRRINPFARQFWSPRGHTPLRRRRTRSYRMISAISAECIVPRRDCVPLYF